MDLSISASWILTTILFLLWQKNVNAISCYICSWSPEDKELEADRCTNEHFDEHRVRSLDCKIGCEKVTILDSNGELLMFYRNCLMSSPTKLDYDRKHTERGNMTHEDTYACDSDLCNAATKRRGAFAILLISLLPSLSSPSFF